ncbi:MAG: AAA family ATPase [Bacillota bacterium]
MRQIQQLLIENFQSHVRSELTFGPGLNVIIGPSDNGKSAVLRALRWALYNEPRGTEFVRSGARECRVTVTMSDGVQIVRELILTKSGATSRSRYLVRIPGQEEQQFEGFGTEVPAEVIRAHGMPQVLLDADKRVVLSLGSQLEGPFLMSETGSLRARAIGRLLGVHVVDAAVRSTQKDLRSARFEVTRLEREVARYDEELKPYADIPEQEARLARAEELLARVEQWNQRLERLVQIRTQLETAEAESIRVDAALARLDGLNEARERLLQAEGVQRQAGRLERLAADLGRVEQESRTYRSRLAALTALETAEARAREAAERQARLAGLTRVEADLTRRSRELAQLEQAMARLTGLDRAAEIARAVAERSQRIEQLQARRGELADVQGRIAKGQELVREQESALRKALTDYEGVLRRLGKCPTCLQPVEPGAIRRIIVELAGGEPSGHHH